MPVERVSRSGGFCVWLGDMNGSNGVNEWTPEQLQFQVWLTTLPAERHPRTQQAFAKTLGLAEETISRWKRLPGWGEAVYALARQALENDLTPILQAQAREAKKGSLAHAQWLFDLAGKWTPRAKMEHSGTVKVEHYDLTKLSDAELTDLERLVASARPDTDARRN